MNKIVTVASLMFVWVLLASTLSATAQAQSQLLLSKDASFSSDDRQFDEEDVLYVKVIAPGIDYTDLDKNEFRLKPDEGGNDVEKALTNHLDGTFTTSVDLSQIAAGNGHWEVRVRVEDENDGEFRSRVQITIGDAGQTGGGDDGNDGEDGDEIEFTGVIEALTDSTITVNGVVFHMDMNTTIEDDNDQPIDRSVLSVGLLVEIKGVHLADGTIRAIRIELEDDINDDDEVEVTGSIESISGTSLVVAGLTFETDENTTILNDDRQPISFGDLVVGLIVEVEATVLEDGTLLATEIEIEDHAEDEVEVRGAVDEVGDSTIVVLGKAFNVLPSTQVVDNNGQPIGLAAITVGAIVEVEASLLPGELLLALYIELEDDDDSRVRVQGPISTIRGDSLNIVGIYVRVDNATTVENDDNNAASLSDLQAGQTVDVDAVAQDTGLPLATHIEIKDVARVVGSITGIDSNMIVVAGKTLMVNDQTAVLGLNNERLGIADLVEGQVAKVRFEQTSVATLATTVELIGQNPVVLASESERRLPNQFTLNQNYPNPFNPVTTITFEVRGDEAALIRLTIFNMLGQEVRTLISGALPQGNYALEWDGKNEYGHLLPSGLYLYQLQMNSRSQTRSMVLMK